jgi:predicted alpha/beta hydrolase family esterase
MKRAVIIHCWEGYPEYCWYPNTKTSLEQLGLKVEVPEFPNTTKPQLSEWLPHLTSIVGSPDSELFLIGHSLGCVTIMRYLESLNTDTKIGGAILVAGYTDDLNFEELKNFFITPLDFEKMKLHCDKFVAINSDNDPYVDLKYADILKEKLGAEVIVKHNMGHFSGAIEGESSCTELPDVAESVKKLSGLK